MNTIHEQRIDDAMKAREKLREAAAKGIWRQRYHFAAPGGWLNDPNGCIRYNGEYHLFYQHNPYAPAWGAMHWGHAVSRDMVHWDHLPIALAPSEPYDDHPEGGVFSGSAVERGGDLAAIYTGTANHGSGFEQTQCLAVSRDGGRTFVKYSGNPVVRTRPDGISPDFRDPRVLRHGDFWYMVVGASLGRGAKNGGEGCALLYRSASLLEWDYLGIIARSGGEWGSMWECPDLFPLEGRWVLTFSPMFCGNRKAVYLVGDMDFERARFTWEREGEVDWGCEYYAAQSMRSEDGRTLLMAWMNGWDWMPWWRDFGPTAKEGWCGSMAIPRSVTLDRQNRLVSSPIRELRSLRGEQRSCAGLEAGEAPVELFCPNPVHFEMLLQMELQDISAQKLHIDLRANRERRTRLTVDFVGKELSFDRSRADDGYSRGVRRCRLLMEDDVLELRVFSDTCSIEIFADGGRTCMSHTVYPTHEPQSISLSAEGGSVRNLSAEIWEMTPLSNGRTQDGF